jgi:glutathione S-transferase
MTIKQVLFATETIAHLQGQEQLLPLVDAARAEQAELIRCLQWLVDSIDPQATGLTMQITAARAAIARTAE